MAQFSEWFINFFKQHLEDIWVAFKSVFIWLYSIFIGNPIKYFKSLMYYAPSFGIGDWILSVFSVILVLTLWAGVLIVAILLLRRYFRFVKKEKDKETLMHEVATLNSKLSSVIDEKNALLALSSEKAPGQGSKRSDKNSKNRFVKLIKVDEDYNYEVKPTVMKEDEKISLSELTERFINFSASRLKLFYPTSTIANFFAGMASSKTMILEGISGTGKTSLPYAMGKFFGHDANIISVQPSWRDRAEMMGYLNEFTKKFNETDFLKAVYDATYRTDIDFIVLDEMNLARVEYYFADFLSLLEMPHPSEWLIDLVPDQVAGDPYHLVDGKILIPQNVWFVGTANKDDSTFTITDKVYDRAANIEMNSKAEIIDAPYTESINISFEYLDGLFKEAVQKYKISDKSRDNLVKIDQFITEKFQVTFGNRILKQINIFVPVYIACGGDELTAIDHMLSRKILRKFESLNLPFLQAELEELLALIDKLYGKNNFNESRAMLKNYMKQI